MSKGNQDHAAAAAAIKERLDFLLEGKCVGTGTPLSAAVATALEVDRRRAPANDRNSLGHSDEQLLELAADIAATLDSTHGKTTLPFGTVLKTQDLGNILLDGELWTLDAGRPGLHPAITTRNDAHGPNLEILHHPISRLTQKLACRRLGLPQPFLIYGDSEPHVLHFAPCAEAGGVVLQCWANETDASRFCGAFPKQIEEFGASIVRNMRSFWTHRKSIAKQGTEMRAIAEARAADCGLTVDAIIVDMKLQSDVENLHFYVHYNGLDEALRPGLVKECGASSERALMRQGRYFAPPLEVSWRYEELEDLRRVGADGWITELAAAVLASGLVDPKIVLTKLATAYDVAVEIPGSGTSMFVAFYWNYGMICAEVSKHRSMSWGRDQLVIYGVNVPETKLITIKGRPLSDLVELPFGGEIILDRAENLTNGLRVHVAEELLLIELASGRIWKG